jgi:outer membrane protein OmpA-like peptidoglycan-associated protein
MDGRRVTAEVPTGRDPEAVAAVLSALPAFGAVATTAVYASRAEARACRTLQRDLDRVTNRQQLPFVGTSTSPAAAGRQMVGAVARLLHGCRPAVVTVGGHTDGSTVNGSTISLQRARVVAAMLKDAGIASDRLLPRGYADQFPVDERDGAVADARNQRVSVVVAGQ